MKVTVEHAAMENLPKLMDLERKCFTVEAYSERQISHLLRDPNGVALVAWMKGDIVGFIIGLVEDLRNHRLGHVVTVDVAPEYRKKGIGSALLKEVEAIFLRRGVEAVYLEVRVDNRSARQLYSRLGYREIGGLEDYYSAGTNGLRLVKRLAE